jgi:uncharacterized protein (DUF2141 family)
MTRLLLLAALLAASCAQVREISGGERDTRGPVLVSSLPAPGTVRFQGQRILLRFDERVQLVRLREGLFVSPPLPSKPALRVLRGHDVEIDLGGPLLPGTTYTLGLGEAIQDITEGNPAATGDFVLSTGEHLDSLAIKGSVRNALTGEPEKDLLVMAYGAADTASFRNGMPQYLSRTGGDGSFVLSHLRTGSYRIAAVRDRNGNRRFDLPEEPIAFAPGPIEALPVDSAPAIGLQAFQEQARQQALRAASVTDDRAWRLVLALGSRQWGLRDAARTGGALSWRAERNATGDSLLLWPSDTTALTDGAYELTVDGRVLDTLRYRPLRSMPYNTGLRAIQTETADGLLVRLEASRPLARFDTARMALLADSLPVRFIVQRDSCLRCLDLLTDLMPGTSARLTLLPKAVHDIYGGFNDTLRMGIGRAAATAWGRLRLELSAQPAAPAPLVVQLLDAQGRVVREARLGAEGGRADWEKLVPGNHRIRVIVDANANGRWDTGDYGAQRQPETVRYMKDTVNVRAGWDLSLTWEMEP